MFVILYLQYYKTCWESVPSFQRFKWAFSDLYAGITVTLFPQKKHLKQNCSNPNKPEWQELIKSQTIVFCDSHQKLLI